MFESPFRYLFLVWQAMIIALYACVHNALYDVPRTQFGDGKICSDAHTVAEQMPLRGTRLPKGTSVNSIRL